VNPEHDGQGLPGRFFWRVNIEDLALVTVLHIRNVGRQLLGGNAVAKEEQRENEGNDPEIHGVDSL